jgi:formate hydrogenlyase transcriptional activator
MHAHLDIPSDTVRDSSLVADPLPPAREPSRDRDQLRLLMAVSEAIASNHELTALFRDLATRLPAVVPFEVIALFLHDPARNVMRVHMLGTADADRVPPGMEIPLDNSFSGLVFTSQQPLVVRSTELEERFPGTTSLLQEIGVESFCVLPLTTIVRRLGAIGFGSLTLDAFGEAELEFLTLVAKQVGVAVDNVLHDETNRRTQVELGQERDRLRLLLEVNNTVVSHLGMEEILAAISASLGRVIQHDGCALIVFDASTGQYRCHMLRSDGKQITQSGSADEYLTCPKHNTFTKREASVLCEADMQAMAAESEFVARLLSKGVKSFCSVPFFSHDRLLGSLNVGRLRDAAFAPEDVELLSQVARQVAIAVENGLAYQQIAALKEKLSEEKLYLEQEIQTTLNFGEIVGESAALKELLQQIQIVAPTDSTVLIQGETGTGKELIARAIHNLSGRKEQTFVKLNCAAIPTGLLESELFGHEKGAFTGAIALKVGRVELANGGTLFLDEVGDIPLELQSKFLRVLQEQEFERLGGTRTIRVDFRLVAATNRDLPAMVETREFRSDLYYRLSVFPIMSPPLRERPDDIPRLVRHFTQKFAKRMNKPILTIPAGIMKVLSQYHWPGNVRELENFIERAVILSRGENLDAPLAELRRTRPAAELGAEAAQPLTTLEEAEREHIRRALQDANWVIGGPSGAAGRLGMKRTTLQSKMSKLGIRRPALGRDDVA